MIENEEQLKITKEHLIHFYKAFMECIPDELFKFASSEYGYKAEAYKSMVKTLEKEIEEYKIKTHFPDGFF